MRLGYPFILSALLFAFAGCSHDSDNSSISASVPDQTELDDPRDVLETSTRMNVTVDVPPELMSGLQSKPTSLFSLLNPFRQAVAAPVPGARILVALVGADGVVTRTLTETDGLVVDDNGDGTYTVIMPGDPVVDGMVIADLGGATSIESGYVLPDGTFYAPASGGDVVVSPESTVATRVVLGYLDDFNGISAEEIASLVATLTRIAEGITAQLNAINMGELQAQLTSAVADYLVGAVAQAKQDLLFDASGYSGEYVSLSSLRSIYVGATGGMIDVQAGYLRRLLSIAISLPQSDGDALDLSKLDFTYDAGMPGVGAINSHIVQSTGTSGRALAFESPMLTMSNLPVNYDGAIIVEQPFETRAFSGGAADSLQLSLAKSYFYGSDQTVGGMFMSSRRDAFDALSDGGESSTEVAIRRSDNFDIVTLSGNYGGLVSQSTVGGPLTNLRGMQRFSASSGVFAPATQLNALTITQLNSGYVDSGNPLASFGAITMTSTADSDGSLIASIGGVNFDAMSNSDGRLVHAVAADPAGTSGFATFVKLAPTTSITDVSDKRYVLYGGSTRFEYGFAQSGLLSGFLSVTGSSSIQYLNDSDSAEFSSLVGLQSVGASLAHATFVNTQSLYDIAVNADGSITFAYDDHLVQGFVQEGGDLLLLHDVRIVGTPGQFDHRVEDRYFYAVCFTGCKTTPDPALYSVGGEVQGLSGSIVLRLNNNELLTVSSSGAFTFATPVTYAQSYTVDIATPPASQTCLLAGGTGVATADVGSVSVTCTNRYSVGGTVAGLAGTLGLQLNGAETLSLNADGAFAFTTTIADGGSYTVAVTAQPAGQVCSITNNTGIAAANITNIAVSCVSQYGISGTLSGLESGSIGVTLNAGAETLTLSANGAFNFAAVLDSGASYAVTIASAPAGHTCQVVNGSGTVAGAISNIQVNCVAQYTVGGTVSGLAASVGLQINGGETTTVAANGSFTFPTALDSGAAYSVAVSTQPAGQVCSITNNTGTVAGNVTSVTVTCVNLVTVSGTVSGATGSLDIQLNGTETLNLAGDGGFAFSSMPAGSNYEVTVLTPPAGQTCSVTAGTGVANASVSDVSVSCL